MGIMARSMGSLFAETKRILRSFGIKPRRKLGQNFVVCPSLIDDLISFSSLSSCDVVLEIGAGIGTLTEALADVAGKVYAVEVDSRLIEVLEWRLKSYDNVELIHADALTLEFPEVDKVVSNLPFSISSPLTFKLIEKPTFKLAVLTYQREFAERLVAKPGSHQYGRLTVAVSLFADVDLLRYASRNCFYPPPEIDVAVVKLTPRRRPPLSEVEELLLDLLRWLFSQRNRKLKSPLMHYLTRIRGLSANESRVVLELVPYLEVRVRELAPQQFIEVAEALYRGLKGVEGG
ncbi:MAG: 16S rRNA (adenine(1518)-N(6)/adenine(1519)-N(6))-dimethyltransferase RsmA [archaeon GB-1867-005]|nr:16S rRNA (adenine(1518)-N(6)/adenine(1519)-N(6))-dimethyltransferase RsmA [Candidatus Culexmicrobium cathedralense]